MSETKSEAATSAPKSSKDILNELFSSFNASYDEDFNEDEDIPPESNDGGGGGDDVLSKKKKKSKKSKKSSGDEKSKKKSKEKSKVKSNKHHKSKKSSREEEDEEDVDALIEKHRKSVKKNASKHKKVIKGLVVPPDTANFGDIVIKNDELLRTKKRRREEELRKLAGEPPVPSPEDGEIIDEGEDNNADIDFTKRLKKKSKMSKKHSNGNKTLSASQAYKLDMEEKMLLGLEPLKSIPTTSSSLSSSSKLEYHRHRSSGRNSLDYRRSDSNIMKEDKVDYHKPRSHSSSTKRSVPKYEHEDINPVVPEASTSSSSVRQAPPRDPSPPPPPMTSSRDKSSPTPSCSSSRSYSYKDTGWQKEKDHYYSSSYDEDYTSSSSRRREEYYSSRNVDVGGYYERETNRRSDGRSGFGFSDRSYYDDRGDSDRRSHHYYHDDRYHHSERDSRDRPDRYHDDRRGSGGRHSSPSRSRDRRSSRRSRSRSPSRWRPRSRSRSSERRHPDDVIDKAKLLEIARKNAAKLMKRGVLPSDIFSRDQIVAIRAGGKSVEELTTYCQRLARKDARGDAISDDSGGSDGEGGDHFIHHPFQVKDRPLPQITMNIRNSIPIPVRTPQALAIESAKLKVVFPVSSGTQHRIKELEWHPVDKDGEEKKAKAAAEEASKSLVPLDGPKPGAVVAPMVQAISTTESPAPIPDASTDGKQSPLAITESPSSTVSQPTQDIVHDPPRAPDFDISDVIAIRLKAMRNLSENPNSDEARMQLEAATKMMKTWADAKAHEPKFLTQSELTQGPQAWAKRDQLTSAKEVQSPMGLHLLQKMGWKPGEGLGKTKSGDVEPLALEVKTDKKGLTSVLDYKQGPAMPVVFDLSGKHPISALMELSAKRKWGAPDFDLVFEHGPPHKKQFVYKVIVNGVEYQPCVAVNNKKLAKANAAAFCLQSLGLLPTCKPPEADDLLQTVSASVPPPPPPPPPPGPPPPFSSAAGTPVASTSLQRFTPSHYLQTVPTAAIHPQPPLPHATPESLMPPPPPPPPLKRFGAP